jgi:hypothetical protein
MNEYELIFVLILMTQLSLGHRDGCRSGQYSNTDPHNQIQPGNHIQHSFLLFNCILLSHVKYKKI